MGELIKERGRPAHTRNSITPATMNRFTRAASHPSQFHKPWAMSCALVLALGVSAFSQSATNFKTNSVAPPPAARKAPANQIQPVPDNLATANTVPSRYVGEADLDACVTSLAAGLSMKSRATDPFGQYQDPDARPVIKQAVAKTPRRTAVKATPFAEIVRRIQVTTIMPGERRFLVGTRSFKQGDRFPISFRGRNVNVEVTAVTSRRIDFRNVDNSETGAVVLNLLPVGMTPGGGAITAPGMVPERANAPLEVESGDAPETSQN